MDFKTWRRSPTWCGRGNKGPDSDLPYTVVTPLTCVELFLTYSSVRRESGPRCWIILPSLNVLVIRPVVLGCSIGASKHQCTQTWRELTGGDRRGRHLQEDTYTKHLLKIALWRISKFVVFTLSQNETKSQNPLWNKRVSLLSSSLKALSFFKAPPMSFSPHFLVSLFSKWGHLLLCYFWCHCC